MVTERDFEMEEFLNSYCVTSSDIGVGGGGDGGGGGGGARDDDVDASSSVDNELLHRLAGRHDDFLSTVVSHTTDNVT